MSAKGAQVGVVDPDLKVKGAVGLRVADASVLVRGSVLIIAALRQPLAYHSAYRPRRPYTSCGVHHWRACLRPHQAVLGHLVIPGRVFSYPPQACKTACYSIFIFP